ncbi:MAG: NAD(P)H-dependent oxidoreductase subunit E [Nitrospinales bacterium]
MADTDEAVLEELDVTPVRGIMDSFPSISRRYLIPMLQKIQDHYRFVPGEVLEMVMDELGISKAQIASVVSFYPQLRITEPGKYIVKLCFGTACFVKGANIIADKIDERYHMKPGHTDATKLFTLETASCLGNCGAAPMALIGDDTHNSIDPEATFDILGAYKLEDDEPAGDQPEETPAE